MNETEMKNLGMKMSASDVYDVNKSSLKDAVPQFNGGCTAEVISSQGLLLTNHHCGFGQIQSHSTVEHDYLSDSFWAMKMEDELPNKDLEVTFIVKIEDVTTQILNGVQSLTTEVEKQKKIQENISNLNKSYAKESYQGIKIRTFYEGNQYMLFVTESFTDVRLVGAPPSSIGKFGSDTDNWVWPRHTGDFSLFRIYADKNNRPANYSKDNVPYTPKHFLPVSLDGISEDDFTLVFGYPGKTTEYLPAVAIEQIVKETNPAKIEIRDRALKVADGFMRKDKAIKIQYASKYAGIANYWKKWIGETQGLIKSNAVQIKKDQESVFQQKIIKAGKQAEYGNLLADFEKNYAEILPYTMSRDYFMEVVMRNTELLGLGYKLYQLEQIQTMRGDQAFTDRKNNLRDGLGDFYKNFNVQVDEKVFEQLIDLYLNKSPQQFVPANLKNSNIQKLTASVYGTSKMTTYDGVKELLTGDTQTILKNLNNDKGYQLVKSLAEAFLKDVNPKFEAINTELNALQRTYMKAQLELNKDSRIFPDANSTLRVTYGKVKGYEPRDAVAYDPVTYLDGVMEKYIPGDYEFDVSQKLIDLYNKKDWEGTMSDIYYDPSICRNIMVDARYILFIIDKYAGATNLINEMKLVHPKKAKQTTKKQTIKNKTKKN